MITPAELQQNIEKVQNRIKAVAEKAGRSVDELTIVAVGKTHPAETFLPAIEAGLIHFGESRIQEAADKIPALESHNLVWHLIGHLQRNKAGDAIELFDEFHALDSNRLARRLQNQMEKSERKSFPVFIQVNTSGEESKYGIDPEALQEMLDLIGEKCPHLRVKGLMTIAPWTDDEKVLHATFANLRKLQEQYKSYNAPNIHLENLSMGMTNDFEIAIEEGATHLRIGRAIFGTRRSR